MATKTSNYSKLGFETQAKLVNIKLSSEMSNKNSTELSAQMHKIYDRDVGIKVLNKNLQKSIVDARKENNTLPDINTPRSAPALELKPVGPKVRGTLKSEGRVIPRPVVQGQSMGMPTDWYKIVVPAFDPFNDLLRTVAKSIEEKQGDMMTRNEPGWWLRPSVDPLQKKLTKMQLISQSRSSRVKAPKEVDPAVVFISDLPFQIERRKLLLHRTRVHSHKLQKRINYFPDEYVPGDNVSREHSRIIFNDQTKDKDQE